MNPHPGGGTARVYELDHAGTPLILRLSPFGDSFAKDAYAAAHFTAPGLPIPSVLAWGQAAEGVWFALTRRAPGAPLNALPPERQHQIAPAVLAALDQIHAIDIATTSGYGHWGPAGLAVWPSWAAFLQSVVDEAEEGPFQGWTRMFADGRLDKAGFTTIYDTMVILSAEAPLERTLVHGDAGFDNLLADAQGITAVLDWANAMYGDPLYDLAWLSFWPSPVDWPQLWRARPGARMLIRSLATSRARRAERYAVTASTAKQGDQACSMRFGFVPHTITRGHQRFVRLAIDAMVTRARTLPRVLAGSRERKRMHADALRHFYAYHFAENRTLWDRYVPQVSVAQFTQPLAYAHGSVRDQLIHLMDVDDVWFSELQVVEPLDPLAAAQEDDRQTLRARWDVIEQRMRAYLAALQDETLHTRPIQEPEEDQALRVWQVLLHVVNHGTDHRAQLLRSLHDLGLATSSQDYIFYVYDHP